MEENKYKMGSLSIIVPVYNAEKYIVRCAESIVHQMDAEDELIFVDDGSPDCSGTICDEYAEKYHQIKVFHQENRGVGAARNAGLRESCGLYVTFVDPDDFADENMISYSKKYMDGETDIILFDHVTEKDAGFTADTSSGKRDIRKSEEKELISFQYDKQDHDRFLVNIFCSRMTVEGCASYLRSIWAKVYRREFLVSNGLFFEEKLKIDEDMLYNLRVFDSFNKALYVNGVIYHYNAGNTVSISNRYKPDLEDILNRFEESMDIWLKTHKEYLPWCAYYRLQEIFRYLRCDFYHRDNKEPRAELNKRMYKILCAGRYRKYYEISQKNGQLKLYGTAKSFAIRLAVHGHFMILRCIAAVKYG